MSGDDVVLPVWPEIRPSQDDDPYRCSSSRAGHGMGESGRVLWWVLGIGTAVFLFLLAARPSSHGHGHHPIRVTGRLVWGSSRVPIVGARVLAVSRYDLENDWDPESAWFDLEAIDAEREGMVEAGYEEDPWSRVGLYDNAGARSGQQGSIEMLLGLRTTVWFGHLFNTTDVSDPEDEVAALWIAPEGREPVLVRLGEGRFHQNPDGEDHPVWGTYDLGTVVVPVAGEEFGG